MSDPRTKRTRDKLGDALIELIQEKQFDSITVQDVLDRAQVGRSTFYSHYKDKEDLFFSDIEEFLEWFARFLDRRSDRSRRVFAVKELFEHVVEEAKLVESLKASQLMHDFYALAEGIFAKGIEARLLAIEPAMKNAGERGRMLSGALGALLRQWLAQSPRKSAQEMDELFHALVWP
jgi:AcrR family transcriptional regulator